MILKKYFFLINLLILFALAFLSARFVNLLIERKLAAGWQLGAPAKPKSKVEGIKKPIPDKDTFKPILERPIFKSTKKEAKGPVVEGGGESCPLSNYTPIGTISGEGMSYVLIADAAGKTKLYKPGQSIDSMRIVRVDRKAVVLIACGKEQRIAFKEKEKENGGKKPAVPGAENQPPAAAFNPGGIKQDSKDHYTIERTLVDEALANMNLLLTQARIIPHFKAGKANGFQVINIIPNSIYDKLGLQAGDVLKSLNGNDLKTMEDAMGIFTNLKNMSHITLTIERGSEKKTMNYDIR